MSFFIDRIFVYFVRGNLLLMIQRYVKSRKTFIWFIGYTHTWVYTSYNIIIIFNVLPHNEDIKRI